MSHFKVKMHQIRFLMSVRLSVQTEFDTYYTASKKTRHPIRVTIP